MVEIVKASREFTKVETYLMTVAPGITSLKDVPDGTSIDVSGTLEFNDIKDTTGEIAEIISIITPDNKVYSAQSKTVKRSIHDIENIMDGEQFSVIKTSGLTKAGRTFINIELDTTKL